ncbi:MAG TPA: amino acid adenylation domain-containing protein [Frateuria sp.]|uniref:polyketide synthase n=1 Tax=Frateuria sp. TaxID=2211372 RepID=UPI002DE5AD8A|nr:polyketide synthase [Frateuria sp.]HEV2621909.1 amino acid adenylation domain-containing protein [Frateuria sp.]
MPHADISPPSRLTLLDVLPRAVPRGSVAIGEHVVPLDEALPAALDRRAARAGCTLDALRDAALALLESRLTGQPEVAVAAGMPPLVRVHRVPVGGDIDEWLGGAAVEPAQAGGATSTIGAWCDDAATTRPTPLAWSIVTGGATALRVQYDAGVFDPAAVALLADGMRRVLHALAQARRLEDLELADPCEQRLIECWNATKVPRDPRDTVHGLFAAVADGRGEATALAWADGQWSYAELAHRAACIASGLAQAGVAPGTVVALLLERSAEAIAAMLGVLWAGAAYLPLDPHEPPARLRQLIEDARATLAVSADPAFELPGLQSPLVPLDRLAATTRAAPARTVMDGGAPAYVMYTSGSTGTPKGVEVAHRGIIRLVRGVRYVELGEAPRVLHAAPLGFDAATFEIWAALLNGGTCVIHAERVPSPRGLAATISRHRARVAWLTAALFNAVVDEDPRHLDGLEHLLIGGEALSVPHVRRALAALPQTMIVNGYGPTECTTFAATWPIPHDLPADAPSIPIGRPIADTTLHVLNARGQVLPVGVVGELHIGGAGLALGYLGQPQLSAERFVVDPRSGERRYRTGDLVRWLPEGVVEFVGRIDHQVKIHGHRIELGEIEAALLALPGVRACAVLAREDRPGQKQLVAYCVPAGATDAAALRARLARRLPDYMVPSRYLMLDALPVTRNGKLDRRALPAPDRRRPELAQAYAPPQDEREAALCEAFAAVLDLEQVGREDHFFELGGSSLLALQLLSRIRERCGRAPVPPLFFDAPTPAGVARAMQAEGATVATGMPAREAPADEPIAIVAMAGRFPGAGSVEAFWENLCAGRESITFFDEAGLDPSIATEERNDPSYVRARGVIEGVEHFDAAFFGIAPREAELMDPQQRLFLELCWECLERAGHVPDACEVPVGVFAGMHNATYYQRHLAGHPELIAALGAFQVMLANEKDYVATRVAHRLNLTGPALSLNTACSTSLVAVCEAVEALRGGRCAMALAGGVAIACPPRSGYLGQEGTMLSPDGHTRSFDAQAAGTVFSDGAGVVLLKRLSDALADGNPVIALIRGGAVNNDGGAKASFMAPSSAGQAAVIAQAHVRAGVQPRSIGYVEAHGTATPIGDPIELEGLTRAFRQGTPDAGFCRIGSLKSNVGHMVTAAGVAGVIKAALALAHEQLPPTLHFRGPNPSFDLATSPFVVNDRLSGWPRGDAPRRAGVSSFGVGGTNAHVVLEEAPVREAPEKAAGPHLLLLSARTPAALGAAAARLADHLRAQPSTDLADVAWTLAVGRKAFAHRLAVVADDATGAVARLAEAGASEATARGRAAQPREVVFLFPGQGAQYAGMGRALHAAEPVFREAFDACAAHALDALGFDLRERVFGDDPLALVSTSVTQPAIFAVEYALAQLWLSLGLQPAAMIGHSVGEFVAATLAGVFELPDAIALVAHRGALMQAQPQGAMLSVRLPRETLLARLPARLSLAAENAPAACVAAGPSGAVAAFQATLEAEGIACRPLRTSHAFHSSMMDPVLAPFREHVARVRRQPPRLGLVSSATGDWLQAEQALSADYWTEHLRRPVLFSTALGRVLERPSRVLLEIGPRATLATLAQQQPRLRQSGAVALASLGDRPQDEPAALRRALGQAWCHGAVVQPARLDRRGRRQRLCLPGYPFERVRHWVDAPAANHPSLSFAVPPAPDLSAAVSEGTPMSSFAASMDRRPQLVARLKAAFEEVAGIDLADADPSSHFIELGLDSLMLTQVALHVSKAFSVKVNFRQLMGDCASFAQLAEWLDGQLPAEVSAVTAAASVAPTPVSAAPLASVTAIVPGGYVQQVIEQQMQLMAQQLALLSGAAPMAASAAPATPAAAAPVLGAASTASAPSDEEAALAHTRYDVKKAFGAIARIDTGRFELSPRQQARLDRFVERYVARTRKSKEYTQAQRPHMADPRVVNGFRPLLKEIIYQLVIERSKGAHLWDLDGNEYVDALNGFGMSLFGWQSDFVLEAVRRQLDLGYEIGPQHPLAGEVAKLACEVTGNERAALCNTGSEAVLGALRIARTVTGRETVVLFSGAYHGINDEVIVRGTRKLRAVPAAPGILRNTAEHVLVLDYGTPESLRIIRERAHELAAVLVEPVQSRRPDFRPVEFLREVRAIAEASGSLLIFDEIVTGFRSHPGGTQALFGIRADLATYGKVIGGGFPIGVIAGKREYMDALDGGQWQYGDDTVPTVGVTYFAGTFVRHPLALAAAKAVLEHLKHEGPALQERLNARTAAMADELNGFFVEVGAPIAIKQFASLWKTQFLEEHPLQDLLFAMMRSRGVHILDNFPCFFTTAHSEADFRKIIQAYKESVLELQEAEFLPRKVQATQAAMDASRPPLPGARLGREPDGRPCWFVPNPDAPGKYMKVVE